MTRKVIALTIAAVLVLSIVPRPVGKGGGRARL